MDPTNNNKSQQRAKNTFIIVLEFLVTFSWADEVVSCSVTFNQSILVEYIRAKFMAIISNGEELNRNKKFIKLVSFIR